MGLLEAIVGVQQLAQVRFASRQILLNATILQGKLFRENPQTNGLSVTTFSFANLCEVFKNLSSIIQAQGDLRQVVFSR